MGVLSAGSAWIVSGGKKLTAPRSTEPAPAQRALPPKSIISFCCGVRIDRHLGTPAVQVTRPPCLWQLALCRATGNRMQRPSLEGRSILIVEDEPLIVMDITQAFEGTGAALTTTNTLQHALILVEHDGLSGAILDHALGDGDSSCFTRASRSEASPS